MPRFTAVLALILLAFVVGEITVQIGAAQAAPVHIDRGEP